MSFFQKYSCGCLGIPTEPEIVNGIKHNAIIIDPCDSDRGDLPGLHWFTRDMSDKTFEEIPAEKDTLLHRKIAEQLAAGELFEEVRRMLGVVSVEAKLRQTELRGDLKGLYAEKQTDVAPRAGAWIETMTKST